MSKAKHWSFIADDFFVKEIDIIRNVYPTMAQYLIIGISKAGRLKKKYIEGYIFYQERKSLRQVLNMFPVGIRFSVCRGKPEERIDYIKRNFVFEEHGECKNRHSNKYEFKILRKEVEKKGRILTNREIINISPILFAKFYDHLEEIMSAWLPNETEKEEKNEFKEIVNDLYDKYGMFKVENEYSFINKIFDDINIEEEDFDIIDREIV